MGRAFKSGQPSGGGAVVGLDEIKRDKKKVRDPGRSPLYVSQLGGITGLAQQ